MHTTMNSRSEVYRGEVISTEHDKPIFEFKCMACGSILRLIGGNVYVSTNDICGIEDKHNGNGSKFCMNVKIEYEPEEES